jgi:signal transduction histidine kinase
MELILQATELRTPQERPVQLVPISLNQVFKSGIPRWQRQARRHNVDLDIRMPSKLPQVVSDPATLDRVLTGLLEKFTRSFTSGGQIRVHVSTAGHQLKLKLQTQATPSENGFKALGQLLLFQPATGSVSLNLDTTKNLCHAMGGKLIVRQRSRQGEEITIFLPLDNTAKRSAELPLH